MQKISGTAALLILAALLYGPNDLRTLGERMGVKRYHTLRLAAQEAVAAGYGLLLPHPDRRLRFAASDGLISSLLLLRLANPVFPPSADAEGGSRDWDVVEEEINTEIDTSIYRSPQFVASEGYSTEPEQDGLCHVTYTESVQDTKCIPSYTQSVHLPIHKPYTYTQSVQDGVQKVSTSEEKQAPDFSDDLFWRVEAADALPRGKTATFNDQAHVRRLQAQTRALADLWAEQLPTKPVTDRSLQVLLRGAEGEATRIADLIAACVERGIEHPFSYIQAALRRQAVEREVRSPRAQTWEYELEPMTEDFAQQLADAASVAKQLWED